MEKSFEQNIIFPWILIYQQNAFSYQANDFYK